MIRGDHESKPIRQWQIKLELGYHVSKSSLKPPWPKFILLLVYFIEWLTISLHYVQLTVGETPTAVPAKSKKRVLISLLNGGVFFTRLATFCLYLDMLRMYLLATPLTTCKQSTTMEKKIFNKLRYNYRVNQFAGLSINRLNYHAGS